MTLLVEEGPKMVVLRGERPQITQKLTRFRRKVNPLIELDPALVRSSVKELKYLYLFTGWRAFSEQVLKIPLNKFRDFGYVKLREFEHGVAEELPSNWPHRKIKAEDRLSSAAVA